MNKQAELTFLRDERRFPKLSNVAVMCSALVVVLLLSGCGDNRFSDVTRPTVSTSPAGNLPPSVNTVAVVPNSIPNGTTDSVISEERQRYIAALEGDTARTIASRTGTDPMKVAELNGIFPDSPISAGRMIAVPRSDSIVTAADISRVALVGLGGAEESEIEEVATADDITSTALEGLKLEDPFAGGEDPPPPLVSDEPLPEDIETASLPASPELAQYQSEEPQLQMPVEGEIVQEFAGTTGGIEGINITAPAGSSVVAADDGEVAMMSRSQDHTAILLIRHPEQLFTVYKNVTNVSVEKGQRVRRGQTIGAVPSGENATLHFEVRIGTQATDPVPYLY